MEIDERIIKQLADMFSVQNQLAIEQDIDRRIEEISSCFGKIDTIMSETNDCTRRTYKYSWETGHKLIGDVLILIGERLQTLEEKVKHANLAPRHKDAANKAIVHFKREYSKWASSCQSQLKGGAYQRFLQGISGYNF